VGRLVRNDTHLARARRGAPVLIPSRHARASPMAHARRDTSPRRDRRRLSAASTFPGAKFGASYAPTLIHP